ncbi:hypothetical protein [Clostridium sp.]|uniref:hypothetical protein n=1 Tax=Clostridium sp. TaxID=1506 RepID=UPI002FDE7818
MNEEIRLDEKGRILNPLICSSDCLIQELHKYFNWFSGVPDSVFKKIIPNLKPYIAAPSENHAVSMAFGARLGGGNPCILIQNSGLGLLGDALYGLQHLYKIGLVIFVALRGELEWEEIQHHLWGKNTVQYLRVLNVKIYDFQENGLKTVQEAAKYAFKNEKPVAVIVHRGNINE